MVIYHRSGLSEESLACELRRDTLAEVGIRALKVYVFIVALIFLGEGFKPLIVQVCRAGSLCGVILGKHDLCGA